jgi:hypothetical protein
MIILQFYKNMASILTNIRRIADVRFIGNAFILEKEVRAIKINCTNCTILQPPMNAYGEDSREGCNHRQIYAGAVQ